MNVNSKMVIAAIGGIVLLSGCMSLDEQLNSPDPTVRSQAERRLEGIVLDTNEWTGGADKDQRIAAIKRIKNQETLLRILMTNLDDGRFAGEHWNRIFQTDVTVYGPLIDGLDQEHLVSFILGEEQCRYDKSEGKLLKREEYEIRNGMGPRRGNLDESSPAFSAELLLSHGWWYEDSREVTTTAMRRSSESRRGSSKYRSETQPPRLFYAVARLTSPEAIAKCFCESKEAFVKSILLPDVFKNWQHVHNKYDLAAILKLACKRQEDKQKDLNRKSEKKRLRRLDANYVVPETTKKRIVEKIADAKVFAEMIVNTKSKFYMEDADVIHAIISNPKLSENMVFDFVKKSIDTSTPEMWYHGDINAFIIASAAFKRINDTTNKAAIVSLTVGKLERHRDECCKRYVGWCSWGAQGMKRVIAAWGDALPSDAKARIERLCGVSLK